MEEINNGLKIYTRFNSRGLRVYENVYYRIQNIKIAEEKINKGKEEEVEEKEENEEKEEKEKISGFAIFLIVFVCILITIISYLA